MTEGSTTEQKPSILRGTTNGQWGVSADALSELMFMPVPEREALLTKVGNVEGLGKLLLVDNVKQGVSTQATPSLEDRRTEFGVNRLPPPKSKSFLKLVLEAALDKIMILLSLAAVLSIVLGMVFQDKSTGWIEGTAILVAVVIVILITATNNWSKERKFRALNDVKNDHSVTCMRDGSKQEVSVFDVVVGDVVIVRTGSKLCADGVMVEGFDIAMNETTATGESKEVYKNARGKSINRFFYSGTDCVMGEGSMLVIAVGVKSFGGKTTMALRKGKEEQPETPLQTNLGKLAGQIGKLGTAVAVILFVILVLQHIFVKVGRGEPLEAGPTANVIVNYLITSLAIIVVAVPEGLPLAVTIALAFSMSRMMQDNNLVRQLESCETMGGATAVCSDKTGTLTQNKMTVVRLWIAESDATGAQPTQQLVMSQEATVRSLIVEAICANSTAEEEPSKDDPTKSNWVGSKTEVALLEFVAAMQVDYRTTRSEMTVLKKWPFASERKRMSTAIAIQAGRQRIHMKGASETVLDLCTHMRGKHGVVPIQARDRAALQAFIQSMATSALRTICLAYCDINVSSTAVSEDVLADVDEPDGDLTLLALCGIEDPLRPEAAAAVLDCQRAGITVRMVTGDNIETARNIALQCHIIAPGEQNREGIAMEGPVFRKLAHRELLMAVRKFRVLARSSPLDKQILVEALQEMNEVVAVTGDGTNDGPALAKANVGFAMNSGTDVAKEASSIVLMDDNFASIVKAVLWGRNVFDSIRKFIQMQITINIVAVVTAFIGAISNGGESPLTAVQLLWVNLVMDAFAALALATDAPTPDMLHRKPYGKHPQLITKNMWKHIIGISAYQLIVMMGLLYGAPAVLPDRYGGTDNPYHLTMVFNVFVFLQIGNEINCRRVYDEKNVFRGMFRTPLFPTIWFGTMGVQALLVEFGGTFVGVTGLNWIEWLACLGFATTCIPIDQLLRCMPSFKEKTMPPYELPDRAMDHRTDSIVGPIGSENGAGVGRTKSYQVLRAADEDGNSIALDAASSPGGLGAMGALLATARANVAVLSAPVLPTNPALSPRPKIKRGQSKVGPAPDDGGLSDASDKVSDPVVIDDGGTDAARPAAASAATLGGSGSLPANTPTAGGGSPASNAGFSVGSHSWNEKRSPGAPKTERPPAVRSNSSKAMGPAAAAAAAAKRHPVRGETAP